MKAPTNDGANAKTEGDGTERPHREDFEEQDHESALLRSSL